MKKVLPLLFFLLSISGFLWGQERKILAFNGYVSCIPGVMFDSLKGDYHFQNLVHNRLNFKVFANDHLNFGLEIRNRLYVGNTVSSIPGFADLIGNDQGLVKLSWNLADGNSTLLNSSIDRYWADFSSGKFEVRIGRQRINWGQTLVWNPNDIFNPYSVFDFDYIERPGCDAVRLQYFTSASSAAEVAVKGDAQGKLTTAFLYRFNKWGYDIQALAGYYRSSDLVAGAGWSGSVGKASFRGEATWFRPVGNYSGMKENITATAGFDRIFTDNSMVQAQVMYCNDPLDLTNFNTLYSGNLSVKELAFSKFSAFVQGTWEVSPLVKISLSGMAMPDIRGWYVGPSADWSLASNLDLSLIWQYFRFKPGGVRAVNNLGFLRLKYSF